MNHLAKTLLGLTSVGLLTLSASADCQGRGRHHRQRYNQAGYSQPGGCPNWNSGQVNQPAPLYVPTANGACNTQVQVYPGQVYGPNQVSYPGYYPTQNGACNNQGQVFPGQVYVPNQVSYPGYYPAQNGACNNQGQVFPGQVYGPNQVSYPGYYPNGYDPGAQMGLTIMQGLLNSGILNGVFNR